MHGPPATPVLDWAPVTGASYYRVHLSRDGNFTTGSLASNPPPPPTPAGSQRSDTRSRHFRTAPPKPRTTGSSSPARASTFAAPTRAPPSTLPDTRSRRSPRRCSSPPPRRNPATEADDATGTEITFTWSDYFDSNRATTYADTGEKSYQSGMRYQFQIDDQPTFASPFDPSPVLVDQPTYTAADKLYPEGPLYWRVQPIDGAGNALGWSETRTVVKRSERPTLLSPISASPATSFPGPCPFPLGRAAVRREVRDPGRQERRHQLLRHQPGGRNQVDDPARVHHRSLDRQGPACRINAVRVAGPPYRPAEQRRPLVRLRFLLLPRRGPQQLTPTRDSLVAPKSALFRWTRIDRALKYRLEYRKTGSTSVTSVLTPAQAFARHRAGRG